MENHQSFWTILTVEHLTPKFGRQLKSPYLLALFMQSSAGPHSFTSPHSLGGRGCSVGGCTEHPRVSLEVARGYSQTSQMSFEVVQGCPIRGFLCPIRGLKTIEDAWAQTFELKHPPSEPPLAACQEVRFYKVTVRPLISELVILPCNARWHNVNFPFSHAKDEFPANKHARK